MLLNFLVTEYPSLLVMGFCLFLCAFFSCAETAITSLGVLKVKHLLNSRSKKAAPLRFWLNYPARVITTMLFFTTVVNILAGAVASQLANKYTESGAVGIATGLTTFFVLVFGEVIPKSFGKAHAVAIGIFSIRFVMFGYYLTYPIIRVLSGISDFFIKVVSGEPSKNPLITEEEIEFIISEGGKEGVIEELKKEIITGAFDFDETKVREIMTPRTDLVALEVSAPFHKILEQINDSGHSRLPVYVDDIDNIVGVVLAKDLLGLITKGASTAGLTASELMRKVLFTPESKTIMEVFKELQRSKSHITVIIDEYGGTAGIVTLEDILEEFVGEIQDEFDSEKTKIIKKSETLYEVVGSINFEEFLQYFSLSHKDLPRDLRDMEVDTLSGAIAHILGELPMVGQAVAFGDLKIEVKEVSNRRVDMVLVETKARVIGDV
jgi:CBS domain containing-hemolysin-like protein